MSQPGSSWDNLAFDDHGRLVDVGGPLEFVDFGPPPAVHWVPVLDVADAFGQRAAVVFTQGPVYDLRLASEVFEDAGGWYVHLVSDDQWWAWMAVPAPERPSRPPRAVCWPARYVWVETHAGWSPPE